MPHDKWVLGIVGVVQLLVLAPLILTVSANTQPNAPPPTTDRQRQVQAAQAFMTELGSTRVAQAVLPFDSNQRTNWHYFPKSMHRRAGIHVAELTPRQMETALDLLRMSLSDQGYAKATGIMQLDDILRDGRRFSSYGSAYYWFTIFGAPSLDRPWGWRLEGHHLSLNFTFTPEAGAATPAFMGANPAEVKKGPKAGWRILANEDEKAHKLLAALDASQGARAVIATRAPGDIIHGPHRSALLQVFSGLPASEMTTAQQNLLMDLIEEYVSNVADGLARAYIEKIGQSGIDNIYFAWAGGTQPGQPYYYRIHGPTFVIEYDHTQNNPNHVHSVWRDSANDFGEDLLKKHYEESAHHLAR